MLVRGFSICRSFYAKITFLSVFLICLLFYFKFISRNNNNAVDKATENSYVDFGKFDSRHFEHLIRLDLAKQVAKLLDKSKDGSRDIEILKIEFQGTNLELVQLLQQMMHNDPVQRPTVSEIIKSEAKQITSVPDHYIGNEKRKFFIVLLEEKGKANWLQAREHYFDTCLGNNSGNSGQPNKKRRTE